MSDFDELMGLSHIDLVSKVQKLEGALDKLRKEHRSMSKGAQTNARVIKLQAERINRLQKQFARHLDAEEPSCGWPALVDWLLDATADQLTALPSWDRGAIEDAIRKEAKNESSHPKK